MTGRCAGAAGTAVGGCFGAPRFTYEYPYSCVKRQDRKRLSTALYLWETGPRAYASQEAGFPSGAAQRRGGGQRGEQSTAVELRKPVAQAAGPGWGCQAQRGGVGEADPKRQAKRAA
jgi:hypothetical protein